MTCVGVGGRELGYQYTILRWVITSTVADSLSKVVNSIISGRRRVDEL